MILNVKINFNYIDDSEFRREKKGESFKLVLDVELKDLYVGKDFEVEISKQVICPKCGGSGAKNKNEVIVCSACKGRGIRIITQQLMPGFIQQVQTT